MKSPKVAIVVLNWNSWKDTKECLDSICKIKYPNYELIIVDNGSVDNSVAKIHEWIFRNKKRFKTKNCKIILNNENYGYAEGNNIAIKKIITENISEYILILNNDTTVHKDFLDKLVYTMENDRRVGIVGPHILNYYTKKSDFAGGNINWFFGSPVHLNHEETRYTNFITGCCILLRTADLKKIGGFDKKYFCYFEDADLCERMKLNNKKLMINKDSIIYHKISNSPKSEFIQYIYARNRVYFNKKYNQGVSFLFFFFWQIILKPLFAIIMLDIKKLKLWNRYIKESLSM